MDQEAFERCYHSFDVCVIGGGMAGLCAAISAARNGAKTALVQDRSVLGGNASSEVRMWILGARGRNLKETGVLEELQLENLYRNPEASFSVWDSVLYEKAAFQPNLCLFLNCTCFGGDAEGPPSKRRLNAIECWQLTTQLRHQIDAKVFVDASGDSILAPISGAEVRWGRESRSEFDEDIAPEHPDRRTMGNSILLQLRETGRPRRFTPPDWAYRFDSPEEIHHRIQGVNAQNFWWLELGGFGDTLHGAESISQELYKTVWGVWDYLKNRAPDREQAANWTVEWVGTLPGKRENRRYVGPHILTQHDVRSQGKFDDTVAYGGWSLDDHHPAGLLYPGLPTLHHACPSPYGIPFRCLVSRNVENLMFAGRNISATHVALSSTRVMGTCAVIGQAVGTAAAFATRYGIRPAALFPDRIPELQQQLMADDAFLPGLQRGVHSLTQQAEVDFSRSLLLGYDRPLGDDMVLPTVKAGASLEYRWSRPAYVPSVRLVFDSNLNHRKTMPCRYRDGGEPAELPSQLARAYRLEVQRPSGGWETAFADQNNHRRLVYAPVRADVSHLRLTIEAFWGSGNEGALHGFEPAERTEALPNAPAGPSWREVVAQVPADELRAPDSGLEEVLAKRGNKLGA